MGVRLDVTCVAKALTDTIKKKTANRNSSKTEIPMSLKTQATLSTF